MLSRDLGFGIAARHIYIILSLSRFIRFIFNKTSIKNYNLRLETSFAIEF
jgi:hypothetical protein